MEIQFLAWWAQNIAYIKPSLKATAIQTTYPQDESQANLTEPEHLRGFKTEYLCGKLLDDLTHRILLSWDLKTVSRRQEALKRDLASAGPGK